MQKLPKKLHINAFLKTIVFLKSPESHQIIWLQELSKIAQFGYTDYVPNTTLMLNHFVKSFHFTEYFLKILVQCLNLRTASLLFSKSGNGLLGPILEYHHWTYKTTFSLTLHPSPPPLECDERGYYNLSLLKAIQSVESFVQEPISSSDLANPC